MNRTDRSVLVYLLIVSMIGAPMLAQTSGCGPETYTIEIPQNTARIKVSWGAPGSLVYASEHWDCNNTRHTASMSGGSWQFTVTAGGQSFSRSGSTSLMGYNAGGWYGHDADPRPPDLPGVSGKHLMDTAAITESGPANVTITQNACVSWSSHWDGWPERNYPPSSASGSGTLNGFGVSVHPYILGLGITHELPQIPADARVRDGCVQYKSVISGNVFDIYEYSGVSNVTVTFQSDRNTPDIVDTMEQPLYPSNTDGFVTGAMRTRRRGTATITGRGSDIATSSVFPAYVDFHEADYENEFRVTAYANARETDFDPNGVTVVDPPGLTGTFLDDFLYSNTGVLMQGSGVAANGDIVTIDWNASVRPFTRANLVFRTDTCARGANNQCLTENSSIAVDRTIIPMGPSTSSPGPATVNIDTVGDRVAEDTGDAIIGNRIDLFVPTVQEAFAWGHQNLRVRYLSGGGDCD